MSKFFGLGGGRCGQSDGETTAYSQLAGDIDRPFMLLDDRPGDR